MSPEQQAAEGLKAIPAITVTGMTFAGFAVQEWLILLTALYTALQIALLIRRLVTARREGDPDCARRCPTVRRLRDGDND